jgi:hypothetical protein
MFFHVKIAPILAQLKGLRTLSLSNQRWSMERRPSYATLWVKDVHPSPFPILERLETIVVKDFHLSTPHHLFEDVLPSLLIEGITPNLQTLRFDNISLAWNAKFMPPLTLPETMSWAEGAGTSSASDSISQSGAQTSSHTQDVRSSVRLSRIKNLCFGTGVALCHPNHALFHTFVRFLNRHHEQFAHLRRLEMTVVDEATQQLLYNALEITGSSLEALDMDLWISPRESFYARPRPHSISLSLSILNAHQRQ